MEFVAKNLTFPFSPHCSAGGHSQRFGSYHRPFLGSWLVTVQNTFFHPRVVPGSPKSMWRSPGFPAFFLSSPWAAKPLPCEPGAVWGGGGTRHRAFRNVCCLAGCYLLLLSRCLFLFNTNFSQNIELKNLGGFQNREKTGRASSGQALQLPFPGKGVHGKSLLLGRHAIGYYFISLWNNSSWIQSIPAPCAVVSREGSSPISYLLFFAMVFLAHLGLWDLALGSQLGWYILSNPKWKQDLPSSQADPAHASLSPSCPTLKLFDPLLPEPLSSSIPQSADPCSSSCPSCCPSAQSSLLHHPLYLLSSRPPTSHDFKTLLLPDSCLWLSSHHLLCLYIFTYDSTAFQSHDQAKWTDGGTEEPVTWLCSNLGFSLSLLLCLWLPLAVLPWFLTQMIN